MAWREESIAFHKNVVEHRFGTPPDFRFLALCIAGEAGELANVAKKDWRADWGFPIDAPEELRQQMIDEAADVMIYLLQLAASMDFDLDEACQSKWDEVKARAGFEKYLPSEPNTVSCRLCGEFLVDEVDWIEACPRPYCPMK